MRGWVAPVWLAMQREPMVKAARRIAETRRASGDLWAVADAVWQVGYAMFCGRPAEAAAHIAGAMRLADKVGHRNAVWMGKSRLGVLPSTLFGNIIGHVWPSSLTAASGQEAC